jgi:hypothetical protein
MDRITKQLLSDFFESQEIPERSESDDFEKFCNYTVIADEYNKTFDVDLVSTGSGNDTGIDGIAIIVNGHLVEDIDEVNDLLENNGFLDVTYIFIQAKTSSNFDTKEMHAFYFGVSDFFSEEPKLPRNDAIVKYAEISNHIINNASDFKENPKCKTFFITTGVYNPEDGNLLAAVNAATENLKSYNLFEKIDNVVLGANELGKLYRKSKNPTTSTFVFSNKVTLPDVEGINEAYFGIVPFSEFKKILTDDNEHMLSVFDDNVRDFQGISNPVNQGISETLSSDTPNLFSVLNNGVTVVADSIKTAGNNLTISDYQIVNGCQTSNVLYESRGIENIDTISIPLRLIVTDNEDVKAKITVSTNSQTAIKKEQLSAMSDFQKNLEHYYSAIEGDGKLYYERRAKQYNSNRNIIKRKIITVPIQIKTFYSMFNQNPHLVTSYFGSLVKNVGEQGSKIFEPDHQFAPYYLAGLTFYRLDGLFNSGEIDKKYRKVKFYLTMLVPMIASDDDLPPLNSQRKAERYCAPLIEKLNDEEQCKRIFITAAQIIDNSGADIEDKQALKSKAMTEQILGAYNGEKI